MTIEVTDINIKIGQKKVSLSPEQARELMEVLEALLSSEPKVIERIIERPYRYWAWNTSPTWAVSSPNTTGQWRNITTNNDAGSYTLTLNQ